jgi:hypothetical protein
MTPFPRRTAGFVTLVILAATAGPVRAQATSSARLVAFRDATHLVAASRTDVEIWDLDTGRLVRALDLDRGFSEVERVLSPDGRLLALHRFLKLPFVRPPPDAGSGLHDTRLLDVDTGKEIILKPAGHGPPRRAGVLAERWTARAPDDAGRACGLRHLARPRRRADGGRHDRNGVGGNAIARIPQSRWRPVRDCRPDRDT